MGYGCAHPIPLEASTYPQIRLGSSPPQADAGPEEAQAAGACGRARRCSPTCCSPLGPAAAGPQVGHFLHLLLLLNMWICPEFPVLAQLISVRLPKPSLQ